MSRDLPRAQVEIVAKADHLMDPQSSIPPFTFELPHTGTVTMLHADFAHVGEIEVNHGAARISIMIGTKACGCGCGATGRGVMYTPDVAAAREFAAALVKRADAIEAAAQTAAADLLARAAQRPGK